MLEPAEHVPHTLIGTVHGVGGSWVGADVPEDLLDLATVWSSGPRGMAEAKLDLAGVIRLRELLGEVAAAMLAASASPAKIPPSAPLS